MGDRIMSRPLDPGADANWDNTFGTASKPPLVQKPTYEELAASLKAMSKWADDLLDELGELNEPERGDAFERDAKVAFDLLVRLP